MLFYIVVNPAGASGRAWKLWKQLEPCVQRSGCRYKVCRSSVREGIGDICRRLTSDGKEVRIIVIGGDGTANEAVNGIRDLKNTLIGFIPCGTGNDLGRDMSLPKSKKRLLMTMLDGSEKRTADIGLLTFFGEDKTVKRRFNISSDIGFGAATCAYADSSRIKPLLNRIGLGRLIYLIEAVRVCFTAKPAAVRVICDGSSELYKRCLCAIVMNHCHEGGGFKFCPNADFNDGKLDICIGDGLSHPEFLRMLPNAYLGKHLRLSGIFERRGEHIKLISSEPLWVHTDGEVLGKAKRVSMKLLPDKLRLLY